MMSMQCHQERRSVPELFDNLRPRINKSPRFTSFSENESNGGSSKFGAMLNF